MGQDGGTEGTEEMSVFLKPTNDHGSGIHQRIFPWFLRFAMVTVTALNMPAEYAKRRTARPVVWTARRANSPWLLRSSITCMKTVVISLTLLLPLASCRKHDEAAGTHPQNEPPNSGSSRELVTNFPLLPIIEKSLWNQLLEAEAKLASAEASGRETATHEVIRLTEKLRSKHPFKADDVHMELGGIVFDKVQGRISIPARVEFPDSGDERHPGEVELLLCTMSGRLHETLFVTDARPLHLELLMHLAGHVKGSQESRFRIEVLTKSGTRIPVDSLVRAIGGESLDRPLLWEFSGSDYKDLYSPDLSGDFAIFWHSHDAVLRVTHEGIATGVVKLAPVPHPELKDGDPVVLELIQ